MTFSQLRIFSLFTVLCILLSCSNDPSEDSSEIDGTIAISSIIEGQIVDTALKIDATINGTAGSVEVFIDSQSIYSSQNATDISVDFDPEGYSAGSHVLKIVLIDANGKTAVKELTFEIQRRLIAINLPENMVNQYIINAVVFASKMDGSLISAKLFSNADETITLSSPEEFGENEEFMLTFALTDNGTATGMSTHANLTRSNPGTINLTKPFRGSDEGDTKTYPALGFQNNEFIRSGNTNEPYNSDYWLQLDAAAQTFTVINIFDVDGDTHDPKIYYLYGYNSSGLFNNYQYLTLYPPLADDFVLDKADFSTEGLEVRTVNLNSSQGFDNNSAFMNLYGYWTANDYTINNFHLLYNVSQTVTPGDELSYTLNNNFHDYRYWVTYDNYYAAGTGVPKSSYTILNNTVDFTYADNQIEFDITGTDHIIGRIRLFDLDVVAPIYVWDITFNSQTTQTIALPQLPDEMERSNLLDLYKNNLMEVSSTELVTYRGVSDYAAYIQKVIKDHKDPLQVTDGQELIYKGNGPYHDGPIKDFPFQ